MACYETHATLRIFSEDHSPDAIASVLGIKANEGHIRDLSSRYRPVREANYWAWCTRMSVDSRDNNLHLDAVIEKLMPRRDELAKLQGMGCRIDIVNYWVSNGVGGPYLSVDTMRALVELNLPVWWDMCLGQESEYEKRSDSVA
jgi:Domain of unknown function (DUF4279)